MNSLHRIATGLVAVAAALSIAPASARAQGFAGGHVANGFGGNNGFNAGIGGFNAGFGGNNGFNAGFGGNNGFGGFNNGFGGNNGFNGGFAVGAVPGVVVGGGFGNGAGFGYSSNYGSPYGGYGYGYGYGGGMYTPPATYNNLGGVGAMIDGQVLRRQSIGIGPVRRRRR